MSSIYGFAALVIGANIVRSSFWPIIHRDPPAKGGAISSASLATAGNREGSISTIYARIRVWHDANSSVHGVNYLSLRAWTLQEQLLVTMMVHFLLEKLIWECRSGSWCECFDLDPRPYHSKIRRMGIGWEWNTIIRGSRFKFWRGHVINAFMNRHIIYSADFFPALSGIVAHIQQHWACEYPSTYRGVPSYDVIEAHCDRAGHDPSCAVKVGYLA
ncbi:hypothetical protein MCOR25_011172 [Pyricularia grisea]|nr:hypothetical protein MCOR25_011172 [Pyricularia grisea]